ncbi:MAG: DUF2938 domain-containing protein [Paracoccaceae bacterium]|uniref:DUF2938 domain-containing protein n=1 Tax=Pseudophaeobacter sp. TaxID=1971739 RepID=UPI003297F668
MLTPAQIILRVIFIGLGATAIMDVWAVIAEAAFEIPQSNFAMVGRWLGHMPQGNFNHDSIRAAAPVAGEGPLGWVAHYLVGMIFAALYVTVGGQRQLSRPQLLIALSVGVATIVFPFFLMQPAMGAGVMASNRPDPTSAQLKSLMSHFSFGVGLYFAAWIQANIMPSSIETAIVAVNDGEGGAF